MNLSRIIPVILLSDAGMVKTKKFNSPTYIGDPINAVRIFNDKEVDELFIIDIDASRIGREPNFQRIEELASESFMPVGYGGGVHSIEQMERLFKIGVEKVIINSALHSNRMILSESTKIFGSQSIVASIDVKRDIFGKYNIYSKCGSIKETVDLFSFISYIQEQGAGEVVLNSIDRDGTMTGFDLKLISKVSDLFSVPFVVLGGAGCAKDLIDAFRAGASSVAAGSMFVFHGKHKAVLISYLSPKDLYE